MFNGSRGPLLRKATAVDWAGDPIEVEHRFQPLHGEHSYQQMLAHFEKYNDIVGDNPMNLEATSLAFNAYCSRTTQVQALAARVRRRLGRPHEPMAASSPPTSASTA